MVIMDTIDIWDRLDKGRSPDKHESVMPTCILLLIGSKHVNHACYSIYTDANTNKSNPMV